MLLWSGKQIFSSSQSQVVETISTSDVEFALASLFKKGTNNKVSKLASYFETSKEIPEVVVLFVEPELSTDRMSVLASAYASNTGGAFSHLKDTLAATTSSLVIPYATAEDMTLLDDPLSALFDSIKEGSIFMARMPGSELFIRLGRQSGVKNVAIDSLIGEMKSANAFTNGVTDLVVVCFELPSFGKQAAFASHDEIIGSLSESIRSATKGNYVALFSANMPSPSYFIWTFEQHSETEYYHNLRMVLDGVNCTNCSNCTNCTCNNCTTNYINYFPGPLIEVYLIAAIMITMLFTGGCAIFSLQTPDRWEAPKVKREQF